MILRNLEVPTGNILIVQGTDGPIECVSLGDYGKEVNLKADFLGLKEAPNQVRHTKLLPLEDKWVITISSQYGCSMKCKFCDVPKVGPGKNLNRSDLIAQVYDAMSLHPEVTYSNRLNLHVARMGEPTWNFAVIDAVEEIHRRFKNKFKLHPVVSTMMPKKNPNLWEFIDKWIFLKNKILEGEAGLQFSINSTSEVERYNMFSGNCSTLHEINHIMEHQQKPKGRKYTLNFAVADYEINPEKLLQYFDPDQYVIKLTPMHKTHTALDNNIETEGDYTTFHPYEEYEYNLKKAGYDVLVFIASKEEDEGLITCGNAILSGSLPKVYKEL